MISDTYDPVASSFIQLFKNGNLAVVFTKYNGEVVDANPSFLNLFGFSKEELISRKLNWKKFTPYEFLPTL